MARLRHASSTESFKCSESNNDAEKKENAVERTPSPRKRAPMRLQALEDSCEESEEAKDRIKLQSPSKKAAKVPSLPLRPSLDAFWDVQTINDWNDQYSPKKEWKSSPKKKLFRTLIEPIDDDLHLALKEWTLPPKKTTFRSLGDESTEKVSTNPSTPQPKIPSSPTKRSKVEVEAKRSWEKSKHALAEAFLSELDQAITNGQLGALSSSTGGVRFIWSRTLNTTAGRANWRRETTTSRHAPRVDGTGASIPPPTTTTTVTYKHFATIELAEKVIDSEHRLLNVIAHEFCHLCNFMISGIKDQPHGAQFKLWGRKTTAAFAHRGVQVTAKHSYEIEYKYIWQCTQEGCEKEYGRHSKSIDPVRHTCGSCKARLIQIKPVPRKKGDDRAGEGGQKVSPVKGYAAYVKANYAEVKKRMDTGVKQKEIMEAVAKKYRAEKEAGLLSQVTPPLLDAKVPASTVESRYVEDKNDVAVKANHDEVIDQVAKVLEVIVIDDSD